MKALLGLIAGAGASYGLYKLISGQRFKKNKKSTPSESPGVKSSQPDEVQLQPGSLLARVSGLNVICPQSGDAASGKYQRSIMLLDCTVIALGSSLLSLFIRPVKLMHLNKNTRIFLQLV